MELAQLNCEIFNRFFPEGSELRAAWEQDKTGASDHRVKALLEKVKIEQDAIVKPQMDKLADWLTDRTLGLA
jgi:hypothetical protein